MIDDAVTIWLICEIGRQFPNVRSILGTFSRGKN